MDCKLNISKITTSYSWNKTSFMLKHVTRSAIDIKHKVILHLFTDDIYVQLEMLLPRKNVNQYRDPRRNHQSSRNMVYKKGWKCIFLEKTERQMVATSKYTKDPCRDSSLGPVLHHPAAMCSAWEEEKQKMMLRVRRGMP